MEVTICADGKLDLSATYWILDDTGWVEEIDTREFSFSLDEDAPEVAAKLVATVTYFPQDGIIGDLRDHINVLLSRSPPTPLDPAPEP